MSRVTAVVEPSGADAKSFHGVVPSPRNLVVMGSPFVAEGTEAIYMRYRSQSIIAN